MRAVWIDRGNKPNTTLLQHYGIARDYYDARDATRDHFQDTRNRNAEVGIYRVPEWDGQNLDAVTLARTLDADLTRLAVNHEQCAVHVNAEAHDFDLLAFLYKWRALRPTRDTAWVIEGMQGGRLTKQQVQFINGDSNLQVIAEAFTGSMGYMAPDELRSNLVNFGIERKRAIPCYDAARLSPATYWDGVAFTQGRLR